MFPNIFAIEFKSFNDKRFNAYYTLSHIKDEMNSCNLNYNNENDCITYIICKIMKNNIS